MFIRKEFSLSPSQKEDLFTTHMATEYLAEKDGGKGYTGLHICGVASQLNGFGVVTISLPSNAYFEISY